MYICTFRRQGLFICTKITEKLPRRKEIFAQNHRRLCFGKLEITRGNISKIYIVGIVRFLCVYLCLHLCKFGEKSFQIKRAETRLHRWWAIKKLK